MRAATYRGIMERSGSMRVYCAIAAGAMSSAGPIPEKKAIGPSFLSMVICRSRNAKSGQQEERQTDQLSNPGGLQRAARPLCYHHVAA